MKVIIWHPSRLVSNGNASNLRELDIELLGLVHTEEELVHLAATEFPDLILVHRAVISQIPSAKTSLRQSVGSVPKVVVIGVQLTGADLVLASTAGADDVVELSGTSEYVVHRWRSALYDPPVTPKTIPHHWSTICPVLPKVIQDSVDFEVMASLITGSSNQSISDELSYSVQTINNRVSRMLARGEFSSRTQLVASLHCTGCTHCSTSMSRN